MSSLTNYINELKTAEAFSKQSIVFDDIYSANSIIKYKRERVRDHLLQLLPEKASVLELNAGTGEDAMFLAEKGFSVHATDISEGMQTRLKKKLQGFAFRSNISYELCSFNHLASLQNQGPYDALFSNFGGLNCTDELDKVLTSFNPLVKQGGLVTLVIIPKFCLWETLLILKGQFRTATRRFFSKNGRKAHIEGVHFKCWYYNAGFVQKQLKDNFELVKLEGLCTIVPPSYLEGVAEKYPRIFKYLVRKEDQLKGRWPWRSMGDYYIISLRKK